MPAGRAQLLQWIDAGAITREHVPQALELTGVAPDGARWRRFLDLLMLALGVLALACAVVFFIAYNWDSLGRFAQFTLVQALMVFAVLSWWKLGMETTAAKMALLVAAVLLGALLALYGQTYQTGADSWQLFAIWAVLMLPWALVGRFAVLWLLLLLLLNLATILYFQVFRGLLWMIFTSRGDLAWLLLFLNTAAWVVWELAARRFEWLAYRWAVRLIALASGSAMTLLVLLDIFEPHALPVLAWLVFAAWLGALYFVYRHLSPDLFMLAGACLVLIVCLTSGLANFMLSGKDVAASFLLLAFLVVIQAAIAAMWLRRVQRGGSK